MNWRDYRSCSPKQRICLDAATAKGPWKGKDQLQILAGGEGLGGKSHLLRSAMMEIAVALASQGVKSPQGMLCCAAFTDLADRQIKPLVGQIDRHAQTGADNGLHNFGQVRTTKHGGTFFEFFDKSLGVCDLRHGKNLDQRKGAEYDYILVDEQTQFTRDERDAMLYMWLHGRNLPFRTWLGATNPDGIGNAWCKKLWVDRQYLDEADTCDPDWFVYIPFGRKDNPGVDQTRAEALLMGIEDESIRKARAFGEWDLLTGTRFYQYGEKVHVFDWQKFQDYYSISYNWRELLSQPNLFQFIASLDYGTGDDKSSGSCYLIHAVDEPRNVWTIAELYMRGTFLADQAKRILSLDDEYCGGKSVRRYCDPELAGRGKDSDGISRLDKFRVEGVKFNLAINDRIEGWATLDSFLRYEGAPGTFEHVKPKWMIHESCVNLRNQLRNAQRDKIRTEDVDRNLKEAHAIDSARYGLHSHFRGPVKRLINLRDFGIPEAIARIRAKGDSKYTYE